MVNESYKKLARTGIYCGVILLILLLIYLFIGRPIVNNSRKLKQEMMLKENKLRESEKLIRALPNPQAAIDDIEKKTQEFKDMGVSRKQLPKVIQLLGKLSTDFNITVISIKPRDDLRNSNEVLPAGINKVYVEMVLNCSYKSLGEFLKGLSVLPTFFSIEGLTMDKQTADEAELVEVKKPAVPGAKVEEKPTTIIVTLLLSTYMVWEL